MSTPAIGPYRGADAMIHAPAQRPALVRPQQGREIAGVAAGVATHLGWPVGRTRLLFVLLAFFSGSGIALYLWLWALVPSQSADRPGVVAPPAPAPQQGVPGPAQPPVPPTAATGLTPDRLPTSAAGRLPSSPGRTEKRRRGRWELVLGLLLVLGAAAAALLANDRLPELGAWWGVAPIALGAALVYSQLDSVEVTRWQASPKALVSLGFQVLLGLLLVIGGVAWAVLSVLDMGRAENIVVALVAMIGGALLVLAPWVVRLVRDLGVAQQARAREQVRADMAAHLHDSVLQTLALIQRSSADSAQVTRLARRQERDLRGWLYGGGPAQPDTLAAAVRAIENDVEDLHAATVDLIMVGDAPTDEHVAALLAALREAMVNAAKHAGGSVSVYVEATDTEIEAFVRDRGPGFAIDDVPDDRLGVRSSIIDRMARHGGSAQIRSAAGDGTEVRLRLARTPARDDEQSSDDEGKST